MAEWLIIFRRTAFEMFPTFKLAYIKAFERMIEERKKRGRPTVWETGVDVFNWWMEYDVLPGQVYMPGFEEVRG